VIGVQCDGMKSIFVSYLAALVALAILDGLWLGVVSREFYKARLGQFLLDEPLWSVAALFYLIHAAGIAVFAVPPAMAAGTWTAAVLYGALFGFCVYAAYDITNLATLRGWPMAVSLVDLAWGAVATAASTLTAFFVLRAVQAP
jgi:uncharacterized membrane protein